MGLGRDLATELPIFLFDKSGTLSFMTLSPNILTGFLAVILSLFLVQLSQQAYIAQGGAFLLLFGLCAYQFLQNRISIYKNGYTVFAGLLSVMCLGSVFTSDITYNSIVLLPTYLIVPMVIMSFDRGHLNMGVIYKLIMAAGIILGVYALYQFYNQTGYFKIVANAPFANPNSLAVFMGVSCVVAFFFFLKNTEKMSYVALASLLFGWAGIVTTSARGAIIGLCIVMALIMIMLWREKHVWAKAVVTVVCFCIVFYGLQYSAPNAVFEKTYNLDPDSIWSRFNIWGGIIDAITSTHPILGNGIGTFKDVYLHYRLPADRASGLHGHNDLLHLILEMGIVVLIPLGVLATAIISSFCKDYKSRILPFALLVFIAGCAMFTSIILLPPLLLLTAIILIDMKGDNAGNMIVVGDVGRQSIAFFIVIVIGLQMYSCAERFIRVGLQEAGQQANLENFRNNVNILDAISLGHHPAVPIFQTSLLLNLWDAKIITAAQDDVIAELNGYLDESYRRNPWNIETLYYRGHVLKRVGDIDGAKEKWEQVLKIDPTYITARIDLASHKKRDEDAYCILKDGLYLKYWKQNPQKLFGMIMIEAKKQGDTKTYTEAEKRLTQLLR